MLSVKFDPKTLCLSLTDEYGQVIGSLNPKREFDNNVMVKKAIDRYRLEVSLCCDLTCEYCVVHMNRISQQGKIMNQETAEKIVNQFNQELGEKGSLFLMGGEPLVNWKIVKYIIEACKGNTLLFTNSYKLDEEKAKFLKEHNTLILTSLDGYTLEHNKARFYPDVKKRFDIVTNNIKNAKLMGCNIGIGCVVHQHNVNDLSEIIRYFTDELHITSFSFAYPHFTIEESFTNSFSIEDYTKQICKLLELSKEKRIYVDQIGKILSALLNRKRIIASCKVGISQRTFYPDGTETQCTKLDTLNNYVLDDFIDHLPMNNSKCSECIALNLCGGGCPWDAVVFPNEVGVDKRICMHNKTLVNYIINDINKSISQVDSMEEANNIIQSQYYPISKP